MKSLAFAPTITNFLLSLPFSGSKQTCECAPSIQSLMKTKLSTGTIHNREDVLPTLANFWKSAGTY